MSQITSSSAAPASNLSVELQEIGHRKALLNHVIEIARNAERIEQSLQSVLLMGKSSQDIPAEAMLFFEGLSGHVKDQPTSKVEESLGKLETLVKADLDKILALANAEDDALAPDPDAASDADLADVSTLLNEFRRRAQTAVSLRVLLKERGAPAAPMALPVPEAQIKRQIVNLEEREQRYAVRITVEIDCMQHDIDAMLDNDEIPASTRNQLQAVRDELTQNLEHLKAGKKVEDLPVEFEAFSDVDFEEVELIAEAEPVEAILEQAEESALERPKVEKPAEPTPRPQRQPPPILTSTLERGFFDQLWTWITTPPSVSWKKAKTWEGK